MTAFSPSLSADQKINQLHSLIQAQRLQGQLVLPREAVSSTTSVGSAVYWNTTTQRWEPAIATAESGSSFTPSDESDVMGVVSAKYGNYAADIIILGLWAADSMPALVNDGSPGRYYLSATTAGGWTKERPSIARPIGFVLRGPVACDSRPLMFIAPLSADWQNDHAHHEFALTALPAGDHNPPDVPDPHAILNADSDLPGWLPASHAIFGGNAPTGAKFGYNLSQHAALNAVWPPQPLAAVVLEQTSDYEPTRLLGRVPPEYVSFDANGIWWMTDAHGHVPWPTNYDTLAPDADYDVFSTPGAPAVGMHLKLSLLRMSLTTQQNLVTSLRPGQGSPITVKNPAGQDAVTGDLLLGLDLNLLAASTDAAGHLVVKNFVDGAFNVGPVVEGLIADSSGIALTSTAQRTIPGESGDVTLHMGRVTVSLASDQANRELFPHITAVGDAVERIRFDMPYLSLPANRKSQILFRLHVPAAGLGDGQLQMRFRAVLFGTLTGTLDELDCHIRRLARPADPVSINGAAVTLPGFVTAVAVTADNAIELQSELFDIAHGDTIIIAVTRNSGGAYGGEIGFVRTCGIVST